MKPWRVLSCERGDGPGREGVVLGEREWSWEKRSGPFDLEERGCSWDRGVGLSWVRGVCPERVEVIMGDRMLS